jgi:hypothetical protein
MKNVTPPTITTVNAIGPAGSSFDAFAAARVLRTTGLGLILVGVGVGDGYFVTVVWCILWRFL